MRIEAWGRSFDRQELMYFYLEAGSDAYEDLTTYISWTGPKKRGDDCEREKLVERSTKRTFMYVNRNSADDIDVEVWMESAYDDFRESVRDLLKRWGFGMTRSVW